MKNGYGLGEIVKNSISLIYTKVFYKGARLIRRPIYVRGKKYFKYGEGFTTGYNCRIEMFNTGKGKNKKLVLGKNCKIGDYVHIAVGEEVVIGDNVLIGSKVLISDLNHGNYSGEGLHSAPNTPPDSRYINTSSISIGDNVWIGDNVCVLAGVSIGNGCIIGANSVINKNVPANSIVVGVPGKVVKKYNYEEKRWVRYECK